jgi:tetratricopeptide (TPR) repeat protein
VRLTHEEILANAYREKGILHIQSQEMLEGIECLEKALKLDSIDFESLYYKGVALAEINNQKEAFKIFDELITVLEALLASTQRSFDKD